MATITKRQRKKGPVYKAEVVIRGQRATQTFDKRWEAERWAEEAEKAIRSGGYVGDSAPGDLEFRAALDRYMLEVSATKRPNTRAREETAAKWLLDFFVGRNLGVITASDVAGYRDKRLRKVGPSTIQKELALLSHLYTVARREWGLEVVNPAAGTRKPKLPEGRLRLLDRLEIRMLLDVCCESRNSKLHPWVLLQLHTCMRPSEGAGLTWGQVLFDQRMIDLPVTKTTRRRVPITEEGIAALERIRPGDNPSPARYVFLPDKVSKIIERRPNLYFRRAFDNAITAAGIDNFNQHDLRHTGASHLLMSGATDLRTLAEILGHRTMQMVMRYTHLIDDHKLAAVDRAWKS